MSIARSRSIASAETYQQADNTSGNGITAPIAPVWAFNIGMASDNDAIDNLIFQGPAFAPHGNKWGTTMGQPVALTYSVSGASSTYNLGAPRDFLDFNPVQLNAIQSVMHAYANVTNLTLTQVEDTPTSAGDIRWGSTNNEVAVQTSQASLPNSLNPFGGDIWIGTSDSDYATPIKGSYGYLTFLHEMGHAVGLVHPHDAGYVSAPAGQDQLKYSVMSYRDYADEPLNGYESTFFPTSLMLNDIQALQYLYGANTTYNAGNTTYKWLPGTSIYETLYDAGGTDTIDVNNLDQGVSLDLNAGSWSQIGKAFWNGQANVRDCLTIAYGCTIENAQGTQFSDTLTGNSANNELWGRGSDDLILGNDGDDTLLGNRGNDTLVGGAGNDYLLGGLDNDTLIGGSGNDTYSNFFRGWGVDHISENDTTPGNFDVVQFDQGGLADRPMTADQLWFRRQGNDLEVSCIGIADHSSLTIDNWYLGQQYQVEQFQVIGENKSLYANQVDQLVNAMAAFAPPGQGQTSLPPDYQKALAPVLAASWV
ncbi:hypothetical protein JVX91_27005 [Pseudomonas sp. PDNC002]|uniref:M10 family metallopeptidase n=1 Tax=Pseudomonas sp. PDNC002 TaxID=2811422 RepID=UPI001962804B|nr:M10 family metallopeptidase [Pseudomonas sp. PDNC002]QRY79175.1 hypothetical protein JVX91_27005 [Pseudomonas sp. PDNC002]